MPDKVGIDKIDEIARQEDTRITTIQISSNDLVFEERVKLLCFHCKNYGVKRTCPPNIPDLDYFKIFKEYESIALVYLKIELKEVEFEKVRRGSTNILHRCLLKLEKYLWNRNYPLAVSFMGGSCKLCKNCVKECNQPYLSRIPLEAVGINVVKTLENKDVEITFPTEEYLYRVGMILW